MFDKSIYLNSLKIKFNILPDLAHAAGHADVDLLIDAANREITPTAENIQLVSQTRQRVVDTLCGSPFDPAPVVLPRGFSASTWGWLIAHVDIAMLGDELITFTQAAVILRGEAENKHLRYINLLVQRGQLTRYAHPDERNPIKAGRLSRLQVEALHRKK
jgi:hypothetical protein